MSDCRKSGPFVGSDSEARGGAASYKLMIVIVIVLRIDNEL